MRRFFKVEKGSVSIYFMIVSLIFFLFSTVLIDFMRIMVAERKLEQATKVAAQSIMSDYNPKVMNDYGLFVYNGDQGAAQTVATKITKDNLELKSGYFNIAALSGAESQVEFASHKGKIGLTSEDTLKHQMLESAKYKGPVAFGEETFKIFEFFTKNGRDTRALRKMMKKQKEIKTEMEVRYQSVVEVEDALKGIKVDPLVYYNQGLDVEMLHGFTMDLVHQKHLAEATSSFEKKQQEQYVQEYNNAVNDSNTDPKLLENLKYRQEAHQKKLDETIKAGQTALAKINGEHTNVTNKITELTNVITKLDAAKVAIDKAIASNNKIKKLLGDLPEGDSEEMGEIRKSLESALVPEGKLEGILKKINDAKPIYSSYKRLLESLNQILDKALDTTLKKGINWVKTPIDVAETSTQQKIIEALEKRYEENKKAVNTAFSAALDSSIRPNLEAVKNTNLTNTNESVKSAKDTTTEKNVRQQLSEDENNQKDAEEQKTTNAMEQFGKIIKVINTAKTKLSSEQEIYTNLEKIIATNDMANDKDYAEGTPPSTEDADDLIDQSFDMLDFLSKMGRELGNKALINEYLLGELGTKQPVSLFDMNNLNPDNVEGLLSDFEFKNKQVEYVMYGKSTPGANYAAALLELIMIRLVCNAISGVFNKDVQNAFKLNWLVGIVALVAYTIIETIMDIEKLTKSDETTNFDKKVAFLKFSIGSIDSKKLTLSYRDHLRLMLLFNRDGQYGRSIAVIEQISQQKGVGTKPTQIRVINKAQIKPWFLPNAVKTFTNLDSKLINGKIELKSDLFYSY
ncbi:hypothetical protein [Carnobacterium divergens]|uniref:hypothetical protein n=1 Tax=Carnobacterium divergens TaxID=2748 RepID=UPI0007F3D066|nr:hypothetical protein [Carnobacterium divergens]SBO16728.1 hypothetical protein CDIV41_20030 [Carnobacterium divergens]